MVRGLYMCGGLFELYSYCLSSHGQSIPACCSQCVHKSNTLGHILYSGHLIRGIGFHVNGVVTSARLASLDCCSWHNTGLLFGMLLIFAQGHARARHQMLTYAGMQHGFERLAERDARSLLSFRRHEIVCSCFRASRLIVLDYLETRVHGLAFQECKVFATCISKGPLGMRMHLAFECLALQKMGDKRPHLCRGTLRSFIIHLAW